MAEISADPATVSKGEIRSSVIEESHDLKITGDDIGEDIPSHGDDLPVVLHHEACDCGIQSGERINHPASDAEGSVQISGCRRG